MDKQLTFATPVTKVPLVGPAYARRLEKLGIFTVKDLLYHIPSRYDDFSIISKANQLQDGETVTIQGEVLEMKNQFTRRGFVLQKAVIQDDTGTAEALWFNQRFLPQAIHKGDKISLSGKVKNRHLESPDYEVVRQGRTIHTGRLVPVYPETAGISSKWLRSRINAVLNQIKIIDYLDDQSIDLNTAVHQIHFPENLAQAEKARERLAFDELLISQLEAMERKKQLQKKTVGNKFKIVDIRKKLGEFVKKLPFELTSAQKNAIDDIYQDFAHDIPMNRLLQGDVGSGNTVVAALAMLAAYLNGYQSVLMAPTEILAEQHYKTLSALLAPLKIGVGIATGSKKDLNFDVLVGTHALININFKKLGLVVIDEQHRFGVEQRAALAAKGGSCPPHVLTMTATPIPRTVALTLYGDLDVSYLFEMPIGRIPIKTWLVSAEKRQAAYDWINKQHTQTFIICPLIEESESLRTVKSAKAEYERLQKTIFSGLKLGLIHGRLKPKEKDSVLTAFRTKKLDILVATPVVEVGIDIPSATVMVIEAADRFGLAQLHQLRGRVGRGSKQSYCLLFTETKNAVSRLKYMEKLHDGLQLAEVDLKFRGPGQRYGLAQHGKWDLKIASFDDLKLVEKSNQFAQKVLTHPDQFPLLFDMIKQSKMNIAAN